MTYKNLVKGIIKSDSKQWVGEMLDSAKISYYFTEADGDVELTETDEKDGYHYRCKVRVALMGTYTTPTVEVTGIIDANGVFRASIWGDNHGDLLWCVSEHARSLWGVTEFKLA